MDVGRGEAVLLAARQQAEILEPSDLLRRARGQLGELLG